jgi:RNA polymerase sigma factor (sigma-70 family)
MQFSATLEASQDPALPPGFTALYVEHYDFLWRCALRMGAPPAELEDIVQDCFIVALRRYEDFDPDGRGRPSTWLFGILRNVMRNHARARRRRAVRHELFERSSEESEAPPRGAETVLAGRLLDEFLTTLDDDKRAAFVLGEIEGMTGPELAAALRLNLNTANSRLRAARRAFVEHFDDREPRRLARAHVPHLASTRAPAEARRRGLPMLAAAALPRAGLGAILGSIGSKTIAGLIFATALAGAGVIVTSAQPDPAPERPTSSRASEHDLRASAQSPTTAPTQATIPPPAAELTSEPPSPPPKQTTPLERLANARAALRDGKPAKALELVEGRRFAAALEGRRIAVEVAALCQLDRRELAQARARAFREANADDRIAAELIGVCWSE